MSVPELHFTIYSLQKLPDDIRSSFRLPAWPFDSENPEDIRRVQDYLKNLSIVHYRDETQATGLVLEPNDSDPTSILERSGFAAYRTQGIIHRRELEVIRWEKSQSNLSKFNKVVKKHGDDWAWMNWNKMVLIRKLTPEAIHLT